MSRSGYSDDYDYMNLYRATVERTIKGKRGQAFLKELATVLDTMSEKRLIPSELITDSGEVCAIGSVCKARRLDIKNIDVCDFESVGNLVGIARSLVSEIEFHNDEGGRHDESPEQRWVRMREWVEEQIQENK